MEWQPPASMLWGYRNHQETLKQTITVLTGGSEKNRGGSKITQTESIKGDQRKQQRYYLLDQTIHTVRVFNLHREEMKFKEEEKLINYKTIVGL